MYCSNCGKEIEPNEKYCSNCGNKLILTTAPKKKVSLRYCFIFLILFLLVGAVYLLCFKYQLIGTTKTAEVKKSVVKVLTYDDYGDLSTGSGFCAYKSNYIITNYHVIAGGLKFKIEDNNQKEHEVTNIVLYDVNADLAILEVDANFKPLKLNISNKVNVGDKVKSIGSPMGLLNSISEGVISKIESSTTFQTTAAISHGNSGGVLLDKGNKVIGITNAGIEEGENLGFAISATVLDEIYNKYENGDIYKTSKDQRLTESIEDFNKKTSSFVKKSKGGCDVISPYDINTFYINNNDEVIFEYLIKKDCANYETYEKMDYNKKQITYELFVSLQDYAHNSKGKTALEYAYSDSESSRSEDINKWTYEEFLVKTETANIAEIAIAEVSFKDLSKEKQVETVSSWDMTLGQKALFMYIIGEYTWENDLTPEYREAIFNHLKDKIGSEDYFVPLLKQLGYTIKYKKGKPFVYW